MAAGAGVTLDVTQGRWAVEFARRVVESVVRDGTQPDPPEHPDPVFEQDRGAFVTLHKDGLLRGCIGRPEPEQSGVRALLEAATGAATADPRFPPVSALELDALTVEVSILTPPEPLGGGDRAKSPREVEIGRDGLIVAQNGRSGLLLPQVPVERDWEPEEFLQQACRKAGLSPDAWQDDSTDILRFSAQVFAEVEPNGSIESVSLLPGEEF